MTETKFWNYIRPKLEPYGDMTRIENSTELGTPDVNYCLVKTEGWFELKFLPGWPVGPHSPVRFRHFTTEQLEWATRRHKAGGRAGLMARIGEEFFFFLPPAMPLLFKGVSRPELARLAMIRGTRLFPTIPMLKALIRKI